MGVNKVEYSGETLLDLTEDTVTPETLAEGATAHDASGEQIVGTMTLEKIPNLTGSIWEIPAGWTATAGYGIFKIEGICSIYYVGGNFSKPNIVELRIGYNNSTEISNNLNVKDIIGDSRTLSNLVRITFEITGGADINDTLLIDWLYANGKLQSSVYDVGYIVGQADGYSDGCADGYGEGYSDGYDEGCMVARETAYAEDKVPLIIQGLNSTNDYDLYNPQIFNTRLCGKSYNETDFFGYDVVTSSSAFDIAVTNSSELRLYIEVHAWCQYTNADNYLEDEDFLLTLDIEPVTDGSASCTTTTPGSNHYWQYEIRGVWFS